MPSEASETVAAALPPGRPGNLTPEQEEKLRRLWRLVLQICGVDLGTQLEKAPTLDRRQTSGSAKSEKQKKKRTSFFSRKSKGDADAKEAKDSAAATPAASTNVAALSIKELGEDSDDKYGQTKQFHEALASESPEVIRDTIWSMVKHDHPDALLLRFLRARKWDVGKALVMLVSTMKWRAEEMHVEDDIMRNGEGGAALQEQSTDAATKKKGQDFLAQIRMGKSFVHGIDSAGRPICIVRVRLHHQGEQAEESLERYTVYVIETARLLLKPPVDTANILFDLTDFSLANMDYTPVKFMIKCFEANYPESLGVVLVHKAPWIFQGIWKIIKGWLDPVVAGKVHFTNNIKDLKQYIPVERIPRDMDGDEDWQYRYAEPIPGENDSMKDEGARDRLLAERKELYRDFESATADWIRSPAGEDSSTIKARRNDLAKRLREQYWTLDPYIRARSYYDRVGVLQPGGKLDYYPAATPGRALPVAGEAEKQNGSAPAPAQAVDMSVD